MESSANNSRTAACDNCDQTVDTPQATTLKNFKRPSGGRSTAGWKTRRDGRIDSQGKTSLYRFFSMFSGSRAQLRNAPGFLRYRFWKIQAHTHEKQTKTQNYCSAAWMVTLGQSGGQVKIRANICLKLSPLKVWNSRCSNQILLKINKEFILSQHLCLVSTRISLASEEGDLALKIGLSLETTL